MNTPVGPILRESRGLDRSVPRSPALVLGTDVRFPEKKLAGRNFYRFFIGAVQHACAVLCARTSARLELCASGTVLVWDQQLSAIWIFIFCNFLENSGGKTRERNENIIH
jgi:hypothetical protein